MSLIVVQRGHVPRTSGATGAPGEQQFAIDTAAKLAPMLRGMGHEVRIIDADEPRSRYAGDMFVSIHYDSSSSSSASGASVGYQNDAGKEFAHAWKRAYVAEGWSRGFRGDNYTANLGQYYGVREARAAGNTVAIITESGFHTNSGDRALMSPARTARSIARAVGEITGTTPKEDWFDMATKKELQEIIDERLDNHIVKHTDKNVAWHLRGLSTPMSYRLNDEPVERTPRQAWAYTHGHAVNLRGEVRAVTAAVAANGAALDALAKALAEHDGQLDPEAFAATVRAASEAGAKAALESIPLAAVLVREEAEEANEEGTP